MPLTLVERSTQIYRILYSAPILAIQQSVDKINDALRSHDIPRIKWNDIIVAIFADEPPIPQRSAYETIIESIKTSKLELELLLNKKLNTFREIEDIKTKFDDFRMSKNIHAITDEKKRAELLQRKAAIAGASTDPIAMDTNEDTPPTYSDVDLSSDTEAIRVAKEYASILAEITNLQSVSKLLETQLDELNNNRELLLTMLNTVNSNNARNNISATLASVTESSVKDEDENERKYIRDAIILNIQLGGEHLPGWQIQEDGIPLPIVSIIGLSGLPLIINGLALLADSYILTGSIIASIGFVFLNLCLFSNHTLNLWHEYNRNPTLRKELLQLNLIVAATTLIVALGLYFFALAPIVAATHITLSQSKWIFALMCQPLLTISLIVSAILQNGIIKSKAHYSESESFVENNANFRVTESQWQSLVEQGFERECLTEVFRLLAREYTVAPYIDIAQHERIKALFCSLRDGTYQKIVDGNLTIGSHVFPVGGPTALNSDTPTINP